MRKFWTVFNREYSQVVKKKSFIIGLLITPLMMAAFMVIPAMLAKNEPTTPEPVVIVDRSGMALGSAFSERIKTYKLGASQDANATAKYNVLDILTPPSDEIEKKQLDSLRSEIQGKNIKFVLVIHEGAVLSDSNVVLITNSDNFATQGRFEKELGRAMASKRLELANLNVSVDSVLALSRPMDLHQQTATGEMIDSGTKYFSGFALVMIMYMMILTYGMQVMRSIIDEKNSRIMEVMVSSVSPFELMMGKILGLGAATLTAVLVWITVGAGVFVVSGMMSFKMNPAITQVVFNPVVVIFFSLYLVTGYIMYSTLFALLGSVVNNEKEAQNFMFPIIMCMLLPVMVGVSVIQDPNSVLARVLSFFPLFSPTMMAMRVAFVAPTESHYSLFSGIVGEATLALLLICAGTVGIIWLTAKIFRVGILMYGKRPTLGEIVKWIKY
jgi:ABC-2 type transport system permease protein